MRSAQPRSTTPSPPSSTRHAGLASIDCGPMRPHEREAVYALYRRSLRSPERVIGLDRWEAAHGDPASARRVFVARAGGHVVGAMTAVPRIACGCGETLRAAWQQESAVGPEHRRLGVATRLIDAAGRDFDLLMAKGTSPAMAAVRRAAGFVDVPDSSFLACVLRPWGTLRPLLHAPAWVLSRLRRQRTAGPAPEIRPVEHFDERFDALLRARAARPALSIRRDRAALRARYLELPGRSYRILAFDGPAGPRSVLVLRPPRRPGGPAWLVDWIRGEADGAPDGQLDDAMIAAALREARRLGAGLLAAFASDPEARRVLSEWGFLDTRRSPRFLVRCETARARSWVERVPFDVWHGDGDLEMSEELETG